MEAGLGRTNARGSGNWRPKPDGSIEVIIAQSTGLVEIQVKEITREFSVVDGELSYMVQMATYLNDLQPHLKAYCSERFEMFDIMKMEKGDKDCL